jgi:hypothetical protein
MYSFIVPPYLPHCYQCWIPDQQIIYYAEIHTDDTIKFYIRMELPYEINAVVRNLADNSDIPW